MRKPVVREHAAREDRQVVALVVGRDDDEDGRRRVTIRSGRRSAAAETISTGSMHGHPEPLLRKEDEANEHRGRGQQQQRRRAGVGLRQQPARAGDGKRQDEQIRRDRRDAISGGVYRIGRPSRNDGVEQPCARQARPAERVGGNPAPARRGSRAARALQRDSPGCALPELPAPLA